MASSSELNWWEKIPMLAISSAPRHCVPRSAHRSPGEWTVRIDQHRHRIELPVSKGLDYHLSGFHSYRPLISASVISRIQETAP